MSATQHGLDEYRVQLEAYHGPLDLLLYLVKRHEIDLYDIPIAQLTDQYLEHLNQIKQIDVERAGDFLVMAATLLEIKSRMLLPGPEDDQPALAGALNELDPRYELVQQLLAYKQFKDAAMQLEQRRQLWQQRYALQPGHLLKQEDDIAQRDEQVGAEPIEIDLEDANVLDLCQAFARIMELIGAGPATHEIIYDDTPIALHAADILDRLGRDAQGGSMTLQDIFVGRESRSEMLGLFLAMLELVRQRKVRVHQDPQTGQIHLKLWPPDDPTDNEDDHPPDWRDPHTGQVQYEWPSEEARQRAQLRQRRRQSEAEPEQEDHEPIESDGD